jgi:type IV secretion system protein VirD4
MSTDLQNALTVLAVIIVGTILYNIWAWRFQPKALTTYGSARWLTFWEAYKSGFLTKPGFLAGDWTEMCPVWLPFQNMITFGPTGSGKGAGAIIPNLLNQDFVFLVDPGGENTAVVIEDWRQRGLNVQTINPFGLFTEEPYNLPTNGFNPLSLLRVGDRELAADAKLMADMVVTRTGNEAGSSKFFLDNAATTLRALTVHNKTSEPKERQHLGTISDYLNADAAGWAKLIAAMKANDAADGLVQREANKLERREHQAPEEFSGIISTLQEMLAWVDDPVMRDALRSDEVDFEALKGFDEYREGAAISVILPVEYLQSHAAITRLALSCAILTMRRGKTARANPLFILDEAASLGRVGPLEEWLVTMRKYRARFWPIFQDVAQLKAIYRESWSVFFANCSIRQFLGIADQTTSNVVRDMLGTATILVSSGSKDRVSFSHAQRPLLTNDELLQLPSYKQIVFYGNHPPLFIDKTAYWERPEFKGRLGVNPFFGRPVRIRDRSFDRAVQDIRMALAFVLAPHPIMGRVYLSVLVSVWAAVFLILAGIL